MPYVVSLVERGEVVVPEDDGELLWLHAGVQLAEPVEGQLGGVLVQELLRQHGLRGLKRARRQSYSLNFCGDHSSLNN